MKAGLSVFFLFYRARIGSRAFYVLIGYYKKYHTIFPYNHPHADVEEKFSWLSCCCLIFVVLVVARADGRILIIEE